MNKRINLSLFLISVFALTSLILAYLCDELMKENDELKELINICETK